ncbi:MAG: Rieske (2Fe-2S) protein [Pseudomonadota bacterium]
MPREFVRAAPSAAVTSRRFHRVEIQGVPILLARLADGEAIAFGAVCPHRGLPLDDGVLWNDQIDCPHHHYTYDARSGANIYPANVFPRERAAAVRGIPVYAVREENGWVWIAPPGDGTP